MLKRIFSIIKNKYIACTLIFVILFIFLEDNNILTTITLQNNKKELERQKEFLKKEITHDSIKTQIFNSDMSEIEKFGRENYYMKRSDEDIFIINREKK